MVMVADTINMFPTLNNGMFHKEGNVVEINKKLTKDIEVLFDEFHTFVSDYLIEIELYLNKNKIGSIVFNQSYYDYETISMFIMGTRIKKYDIISVYKLMKWFLLGFDSTKKSYSFFVNGDILVAPFMTVMDNENSSPNGVFFAKIYKRNITNPSNIIQYNGMSTLNVIYYLYTDVRVWIEISENNDIEMTFSMACGDVLYHTISHINSDIVSNNFIYEAIS